MESADLKAPTIAPTLSVVDTSETLHMAYFWFCLHKSYKAIKIAVNYLEIVYDNLHELLRIDSDIVVFQTNPGT